MIRKAAVQKYGSGASGALASGVRRRRRRPAVRVFGGGRSPAGGDGSSPNPKKNREAFRGPEDDRPRPAGDERVHRLAAVELRRLGQPGHAQQDDGELRQTWRAGSARASEGFIGRKTLTGNERQNLERIKQNWRQAMAQPLLWGKDLERDLIDYMEQNQGEFYRRGGGEVRHRPGDADPG